MIAVLVNAGVLCLLLIAAITTQEEVLPSAPLMGQAAPVLPKAEERPLFTQAAPEVQTPQELPLPIVLAADVEARAEPKAEISSESIVHNLPPVAALPEIPKAPIASTKPMQREVTVQKGDNLEKIARANQTTVDEIMKLNQLSSNFLRVGQVLKLPSHPRLKASAERPAPAAPASAPDYYTVKVGDNPWTIAMKHHMKVDELLRLNGLNQEKARKLKPGDRLRVR